MTLSSLGRQQTALRSSASALVAKPLYAPKSQRRRKHEVPLLTHGPAFERDGVPGVLSSDAYLTAWTEYQQFLVDKLNRLTAQTKEENTPTRNLVIQYARDPNNAALFNYASAAHNNHFFFSTLVSLSTMRGVLANLPTTQAPEPTDIPRPLLTEIDASFSSLSSLRSHFLATADSMFGPGYVWLVKRNQYTLNDSMKLSILATYNAGSPYPGAHFRLQPLDTNTANTGVTPDMSPTAYARMMKGEEGTYPNDQRLRPYATGMGTGNPNAPSEAIKGTAGSFGLFSNTNQNPLLGGQRKAPGGALVEVLLGVSTWEHVWLRDYGFGGKRRFLEAWWDRIDWELVYQRSGFGHQRR
ncbi:MAG: hypothetical protein LQ344_003047 [Seirophora lacunosa]|nr:MAG: hypothetical protein LQ344_003047 [Seirophora lacunosa]